jgi:hypothetical protein
VEDPVGVPGDTVGVSVVVLGDSVFNPGQTVGDLVGVPRGHRWRSGGQTRADSCRSSGCAGSPL